MLTVAQALAEAQSRLGHVAGLKPIDWAIVALYTVLVIALGFWFGRRQTSRNEYFVGSGQMNPYLIGVSLFATLLSTISYLAYPGEAINKGPMLLLGLTLIPVGYLIVGYVLIPIYMRHRVTSAYELLEARLGLGARLLGATMFVVLRLVWMSLLIYLSSKAMTVVMGLDETWIPVIAIAAGMVAVIYTSVGGLRTVVVTDLIQAVLMLAGALLVIGYVTWMREGLGWFPTTWQPTWDTQPIASFDPSVRVTVVGTLLSGLVWGLSTAGGDQTAIQRYMATRDARAARRAYLTNQIVAATVVVTLTITGFALLGFFQHYPEALPPGKSIQANADDLFPYVIAYHLPPVVSGLVVSAMFAAAMSSVDSGVNSITAVVMSDYIGRLRRETVSERTHIWFSRVMAMIIGIIVVGGSTIVGRIPGNIIAVTNKSSNLIVAPLFSLFIFALFIPFARPVGAIVGVLCGVITAVLVGFSGPIFGYADPATKLDPISFQWIAPAALSVSLATGCLVSLVFAWIQGPRPATRGGAILKCTDGNGQQKGWEDDV